MSDDLYRALALIVGGGQPEPAVLSAFDAQAIRDRADHHGVLPMLAYRLPGMNGFTEDFRTEVRCQARAAIAEDLLRTEALVESLEALQHAGVIPLLMKGEHLAHGWYPRPDLRPRLDTDVLIALQERSATADVLRRLGYEPGGHVQGTLVNFQATWVRRRQGLKLHVFDIHWRVANPQVFAGVLTFEELVRDARPVMIGSRSFLGLSPAAAMLLACVHRVAHHFDSDRLVWLYDIHLIAGTLTRPEWSQFVDLAHQRQVAAIAAHGLRLTARVFGTKVPADVLEDPRLVPAAAESSAAYINPRRRIVETVLDDFQALPSWHDRLQLVWEHMFPPRQYMREVYAVSSRAPLPVLYATRFVRGARRWLERPPGNEVTGSVR